MKRKGRIQEIDISVVSISAPPDAAIIAPFSAIFGPLKFSVPCPGAHPTLSVSDMHPPPVNTQTFLIQAGVGDAEDGHYMA